MGKNNSLAGKYYHKLFLIVLAISLLLASCRIIEIYWQYDLGLNEATTHGKVYYSTDAVRWYELTPGEDTLVYSNVKFYFKAVSDSGYALMNWNHPKVVCGNNPNITQGVNITENTILFPVFEAVTNSYTVKASDEMAIENGKIRYSLDSNIWNDLDQNGTPPVTHNQKIWLAAVPMAGYFWNLWTNDASGTKDSIQIIVNKNLVVGATFTNINPKKWKITINPMPTNGNKIQYTTGTTTNPYMDITTNPFELNEGTILFLKAIPNDVGMPPYDFETWTGDASGTIAIANPIHIDKDITLSAIFNIRKYILSLPKVAEGSITYSTDSATWKSASSPADTVHILAATKIYVRIQPVQGKQLQNIQVNAMNVTPDSINLSQGTVTIMMNGDKKVTPIFNTVYRLSLKANNGETIKAYYKNTYTTADEIPAAELTKILSGTTVYIKVTMPQGKSLKNIKVNGTIVTFDATQGTANFTMNSDKEITTDVINTYKLTLKANNGETIKAYYKNTYTTADEIPAAELTKILSGTTVYIKVTMPQGKSLKNIKVNGTIVTFDATQGTANFTMNSDKEITTDVINTYKLTLKANNGETIKAYYKNTYATADEIPTAELTKILATTPVFIKVTTPAGKSVDNILFNGTGAADFDANQSTASTTVNSDIIVTTNVVNTYKLTLTPVAGLTIKAYRANTYNPADEIPPTEFNRIHANTLVFIKITINVGEGIKNIQVNGTNQSFDPSQNTISFVMNSDKIVTASLKAKYKLTLTSTQGEIIKAYRTNTYNPADEISSADLNRIFEGTTVYIKVTPPAAKLIESIKTNGVTSDAINIANGTATVTMNGDKTVTVTFKITYKLKLNSILATNNGTTPPIIEAFSDARYQTKIIDIDHIAPNTVVYLKTTPGRDPVLQTMKTFGDNTDNFAPYQGTGTVTMNSDKTITATFEALSQFPFSGNNTVIRYNGSLSEIVFPAVNQAGDPVLAVSGNGSTNESMFANPANIRSITLPNTLTRIENSAFRYTQNLSSINIPNTVTHIGNFVFAASTSLRNIVLPTNLTFVGRYAFSSCVFSSITIPAKVDDIGVGAFNNLPYLTNVYILNPNPARLGDFLSGTNPSFNGRLKIHVPAGTIDTYKTAPGWNEHYNAGQIIDY